IDGFDYVASSGTITFSGDHYEADTNGTGEVFFVPGDVRQTITLTIIDDTAGEGNEDFTVTLSNPVSLKSALPAAVQLGTNVTATVTILDNETPGNVDYEFGGGSGP